MTMQSPALDYGSMFALLQAWDTDGDGLVSSADFKSGLSSIGFQISAADADCLCRALDTDGTGNIRIDSLAELLEPPQQPAADASVAVPPPPRSPPQPFDSEEMGINTIKASPTSNNVDPRALLARIASALCRVTDLRPSTKSTTSNFYCH